MDMDSDPNGTAIGKLIAKMKKAKFSALRDIARNLGAKEETLKKIYAEKNKSAEMIKQIAVLQVVVNDTYLLLRGAGLFDLETIAVDVGVPKEDIDTALDDDTDPKKILTHMIVNRAPNFDVWDYLAQAQEQAPPKKKQKKDETYAFPAAGNEPPPLNTACGQNGMQEQGEANLDSGMSDAEVRAKFWETLVKNWQVWVLPQRLVALAALLLAPAYFLPGALFCAILFLKP